MSIKRINPRLAKLHRSYSVVELADLLGVHKHTVRGWIRAGLPTVDSTRPVLVHGSEFQVWWMRMREQQKRPCKPGQLYCFKCREPKSPALGMVEYSLTNTATGNLKALCETCGTMMHRRARVSDIGSIMPDLDVRRTQAAPSIIERAHASLNADNPEET